MRELVGFEVSGPKKRRDEPKRDSMSRDAWRNVVRFTHACENYYVCHELYYKKCELDDRRTSWRRYYVDATFDYDSFTKLSLMIFSA